MKTTRTQQDISGSYVTPDGKAQIDFGITYRNGYAEFHASGHFDGSAGQCIEEITKAYPQDATVHTLAVLHHDLWKNTPLNAGDVTQLAKLAVQHPARCFYHMQADTFLASNGLKLRVTLSDSKTPAWSGDHQATKKCPACNGEACHLSGFPVNSRAWCQWERDNPGRKPPQFVKCKVCKNEGRVPDPDALKHGHHYRCTLSRTNQTEPAPRITFDYFGSIADAKSGKAPSNYDVLACISSEAHCPATFEGYCSEMGESEDSLKALQTFRRLSAFSRRLQAFFTPAELDQLAEIQ